MTSRLGIRWAAFEAALMAKTRDLMPSDVDDLRERAEATLKPDDPLFREINAFVVGYEIRRADPSALAELGADLYHALQLDTHTPADQSRSDIYG